MSGRLSCDDDPRSSSRYSVAAASAQSLQAATMDRFSASSRISNPNVFSDEYSLDATDIDQTSHTYRTPSIPSLNSSETLCSASSLPKPADVHPRQSESSENPFSDEARVSGEDAHHRSTLTQKEVEIGNAGSISSQYDLPEIHRSQSVTSRFSIPTQPLGPYSGTTGPSHPYAMYPQVGVGRSPSVTSTSTGRLTEPVDSNSPQHPYSLYRQNVIVDEYMDETAIPLGFPGHNRGYQIPSLQRENELGDIVGPDGHTEQLPPYSRYPEGMASKEALPHQRVIEASSDQNEINSPRYVEPSMTETSSRTLVSQPSPEQSTHTIAGDAPPTGVMAFEEKLQRKAKQRVCCDLPIWTLILVAVVLVVFACIGGAIGGVLGAKNAVAHAQPTTTSVAPEIITVTATPQLDATPISTVPHHELSLPTGSFLIPASPMNESQVCIADPQFLPAWACMNHGGVPIEITGPEAHPTVTFVTPQISETFTYGAQPPFLASPVQALDLMIDGRDIDFGPAFVFHALMDKLVILPQEVFSQASASKRSLFEDNLILSYPNLRARTSVVGEKPWFCWWNSTVLDFFLYVNEPIQQAQSSSSAIGGLSTPTPIVTPWSQPDYPRRIKMREKRDFPHANPPYCQQMQILADGAVVTASPATIGIKELQPTPTTTIIGASTQTYTAEAQYESACYCISLTD